MRKVIISKKASNRLENLFEYLEFEWSLKVKKDFISKLDKSLKQIQQYPDGCPETTFVKGLHVFVITKQTSLFYRYDTKTITVVTIFDTRQNTNKLKKEVK
jgi:plasmid stabilization system protein ParE